MTDELVQLLPIAGVQVVDTMPPTDVGAQPDDADRQQADYADQQGCGWHAFMCVHFGIRR